DFCCPAQRGLPGQSSKAGPLGASQRGLDTRASCRADAAGPQVLAFSPRAVCRCVFMGSHLKMPAIRSAAKREAVIVGVADIPLVNGMVTSPMTALQVQAKAAVAALAEAGLSMRDVDGLLTAGLWGVPGVGQLPTVTLSEYLGVVPRFIDSTNIGGSAFEAHVGHAAMAIERGVCEVALITYGSTQKSDRSRTLGGRPASLTMQFETPWGMPTPIGGYAMAAMRHMHEFGTTSEQLAEVAVAARAWAGLNPAATHRS